MKSVNKGIVSTHLCEIVCSDFFATVSASYKISSGITTFLHLSREFPVEEAGTQDLERTTPVL